MWGCGCPKILKLFYSDLRLLGYGGVYKRISRINHQSCCFETNGKKINEMLVFQLPGNCLQINLSVIVKDMINNYLCPYLQNYFK